VRHIKVHFEGARGTATYHISINNSFDKVRHYFDGTREHGKCSRNAPKNEHRETKVVTHYSNVKEKLKPDQEKSLSCI
jgi:hypothetical protein